MPIFASNFASNSLSGVATVIAGNVTINLTPAAFALEGDRTFVVKLRKGSSQAAVIATSPVVTIKDRTTFVSLTANTATVAEGNLVSFSLVTTNVINGATVYYSVLPATANVTADDFTSNTGSVVITNNAATFALQANVNIAPVDETGENFNVQLRTNSPTGNVVFVTSNVEILDTYKTYNILGFTAGSASPVVSGSNVTFTFTATNVPTGTLFYYSTSGNVSSFSSNTGSFALNSISNTFVITNPQVPFNASRSYNAIVRSGSASGPIVATSNAMVIMDDAALPLLGSGGTYTTANGYSINYFTTSGTLTFNKGATVEYVAISGGGGGGNGGGGSGRVYDSATNGLKTVVAGTPYTVTIGGGGAAATGTPAPGSVGGSTVFDSLTLTGGSGGIFGGFNSGQNGGAGGASSQPFAGGAGKNNEPIGLGYSGGGGGGSGGAGVAATGAPPAQDSGSGMSGGNGGIGRSAISISGSSTLYAGGGGGGSKSGTRGLGGSGGGGNGEQKAEYGGSYSTAGTYIAGTSGNVNTGSGGGGGHYDTQFGYAGGSGIVIVRYSTPQVTFANLTTTSSFTYEGSNVVFTLSTTNVSNNTLLYYYTVGNILSSHFVTGNTGSFRTTQNSTTIRLPTNTTIPANEERSFQLRIAGDAGTSQDSLITSNVFTIKDTALGAGPNVEMLLVAGGGGGGNGGGGGGAGGLLYYGANTTPKTPNGVEYASVIGLPYTITVGAAGGPLVSGSDSSISLNSAAIYTALGGGYGGAGFGNNPTKGPAGSPGGSGGGAGPSPPSGTYTSVGTGTAGQGNSGGTAFSQNGPYVYNGGGGGGAGVAGLNAGVGVANGGNGLAYDISGTYTAYAGGGGGGAINDTPGAGGVGGGGTNATPGAQNTGGGGSSGSGGGAGYPGGPGVVILRYPAASYGNVTSTTGNPNVTISGGFRTYRFWQSGTITF